MKLDKKDVEIRRETHEDYYDVELMTQRAFWNKYKPGCDEHLLVHKLRDDVHYLPELSRIALVGGKIVGTIMYSKAWIKGDEITHEVLVFGPLCVDPDYQGRGIGEYLMLETFELAKNAGYKGIVIFGEPDYYPRVGFKTCDNFGITTAEGENFSAFMCKELYVGSMEGIHGKYYISDVFYNLPEDEVEEFNKGFPKMEKLKLPGQWNN